MLETFFSMIPPKSLEDLKQTTFCMICTYMIPNVCFMDFGLLYDNDQGEYVVFNDVRMANIRIASLVYLPCLP